MVNINFSELAKRTSLIFLLLIQIYYVTAQGIGASPDRLSFEVYKGNSAESSFTIFNPGKEKMEFSINSGLDWLNFYPSEGSIDSGKSIKIIAEATPPEEIEADSYDDIISVNLNPKPKNKGLALQAGIGIKTEILVKENEEMIGANKNEIKNIKITSAAVAENNRLQISKPLFSRHNIIGSLITVSIVIFGLLIYFGIEGFISRRKWFYAKNFK